MRVGKSVLVAAVLSAGALVVLPSAVGAAAVGHRPGAARLTIGTWPRGVFGYLTTPKPGVCAMGRRIEVFVKAANGRARRVAVVSARRNQVGYDWLAHAPSGDLYAVARAKPGCAAAKSRTVSNPPQAGLPNCPSLEAKCTLVVELQSSYQNCRSFAPDHGACQGFTLRGNPGWASGDAVFAWNGNPARKVHYRALSNGNVMGEIVGSVPCGACQEARNFTVSDAVEHTSAPADGHYYTPDQPGVPAGAIGGPLYLNFDEGGCAADQCFSTHVIIWGTLYRR
jgi:hypothetical protein